MNTDPSNFSRRDFLSKSLAGAGAGLVLGAPNILRAANQTAGGSDVIHIAMVGFGKQGEVLFACLKNIPGLHFQAVCDISKNRQNAFRSASRGMANASCHDVLYRRGRDALPKRKVWMPRSWLLRTSGTPRTP
jgi:hypothetical protein